MAPCSAQLALDKVLNRGERARKRNFVSVLDSLYEKPGGQGDDANGTEGS